MKKTFVVLIIVALGIAAQQIVLDQLLKEEVGILDFEDSGSPEWIELDFEDSGSPEWIELDFEDSGSPEWIELDFEDSGSPEWIEL